MTLWEAFIAQNPAFEQLNEASTIAAADFADHHAGGLVVLWRWAGDNWSVKAHESWGDPEDGIVVHLYHNDDPDQEVVEFFEDVHEAFGRFLTITVEDALG